MPDPVRELQREAARSRVRASGLTRKAVDAALARTVRQPNALRISYSAFLVGAQRVINAEIRKGLAAMAPILDTARRIDAARYDDLTDDIEAAFSSVRASVEKLQSSTGGVLQIGITDHGLKTAAFNDAKYATPVMELLGIGNAAETVERSIVRGWVVENTQLVRNMNAEQLGQLQTLMLRALRDGSRSAQVQADIRAILNTSENRARLIARDQIGKLNGQLDRQKQTEAGLDSYAWRGSLDARERASHVAREGKIFRWDRPPPDGAPGQPVQCRCSPEPNLAPLLGPEFAPAPRDESDFSQATPEARRENARLQARKRARRARR